MIELTLTFIGFTASFLGLLIPLVAYPRIRHLAYKMILWLYPPKHRKRYGDECLDVFMLISEDRLKEAGWLRGLAIILQELSLALVNSTRAWKELSKERIVQVSEKYVNQLLDEFEIESLNNMLKYGINVLVHIFLSATSTPRSINPKYERKILSRMNNFERQTYLRRNRAHRANMKYLNPKDEE